MIALREALSLYLCTDRILARGRPIEDAVEQAISGGVTMVQIREKDASTRDFYDIALKIQKATRRANIPLVVNDRLDIALAIGADGLHIGQSDMPLAVVRHLAGNRMFIGVSAGTAEEAREAETGGADYIGAGAIFTTGSKTDALAIGLEGLAQIRAAVKIPIVAIGGINAENTRQALNAGADGIAVISAILSVPDIPQAARQLRSLIQH
jgi:thiamine-phosphate pyrophosphorylase